MPKIEYKSFISRKDLQTNPSKIFVFGDNDLRRGYGGQAKEMRGEPNAVGIRVKKSPSMLESSFYSDKEFDNNIKKIYEDITCLVSRSHDAVMVFPTCGIGTGMAMLNKKAPNTFCAMNELLLDKFGIVNPMER